MPKNIYFIDCEFACTEEEVDKNSMIAIGVVGLDHGIEIEQILKPWKKFKELPLFCIALTGISTEAVMNAPKLEEVYEEIFGEIVKDEHIIYAWGDDGKAIDNIMGMKRIENKLNIVDFQKEVRKECGLEAAPKLTEAMGIIETNHRYRHHSVLDDTLMLRDIYKAYKNGNKEKFRKELRYIEFEKKLNKLYEDYKDVIEKGV